jgi:hypothetical protein
MSGLASHILSRGHMGWGLLMCSRLHLDLLAISDSVMQGAGWRDHLADTIQTPVEQSPRL